MILRRAAALAVVGALALAGCSDDGGGTVDPSPSMTAAEAETEAGAEETLEVVEPPADSVDVVAGTLALSVPTAWETSEDAADGMTQATALGEDEDGARAALNVVGVPSAETDLATTLEEARDLGEVADETVVALPQVSAGTGTLLDLEVPVDGTPARAWVLVLEHEGSSYTVTYLAEPFDEARARQTLGTLRDA